MLTNTPIMSREMERAILRRGHELDCTLRYAGAPLPLTGLQALELAGELAPDSELRARIIDRLTDSLSMTDTPSGLAGLHLHYDGAPRPITEDEAKTIAHDEYRMSGYGRDGMALYRGSDGGFYPFSPVRRGQAAIAYLNAKRADLSRRIMAGECTHTIFYNSARDTFYCG